MNTATSPARQDHFVNIKPNQVLCSTIESGKGARLVLHRFQGAARPARVAYCEEHGRKVASELGSGFPNEERFGVRLIACPVQHARKLVPLESDFYASGVIRSAPQNFRDLTRSSPSRNSVFKSDQLCGSVHDPTKLGCGFPSVWMGRGKSSKKMNLVASHGILGLFA